MHSRWFVLFLVIVPGYVSQVQAQQNTERGAILGGLTGALAGAAIGKQNGETTEGALVGSALGLITGAAIGNSVDQDVARQQAYEQQRMAQLARAVSLSDVLDMTRNGVSDPLIINHIRQHGVRQRLEVSEVIFLHQQGVSEAVITAMQQAPIGRYGMAAAPVRGPAPVIIQQHQYIPNYPPAYYWYRHHHHHHAYGRQPGVRFGISVGN